MARYSLTKSTVTSTLIVRSVALFMLMASCKPRTRFKTSRGGAANQTSFWTAKPCSLQMTPLPFPQLPPLCQPAKLLYCQHPFSGANPKRQVCNKLRTLKTKRANNINKLCPKRSYNFRSLREVSEIYNLANCLPKITNVQRVLYFWLFGLRVLFHVILFHL